MYNYVEQCLSSMLHLQTSVLTIPVRYQRCNQTILISISQFKVVSCDHFAVVVNVSLGPTSIVPVCRFVDLTHVSSNTPIYFNAHIR